MMNLQKAFWQNQLAGIPLPSELPLDKERPPVSSFFRETASVEVSAKSWGELKTLAASCSASASAVLLCGFGAALSRHIGQTDLLFGALGRRQAVTALFPFRLQIPGNPTIRELVGQVETRLKEGMSHADLALSEIQEAVRPENSEVATPLFRSVCFLAEGTGQNPQDLAGARFADSLMEAGLVLAGVEKSGALVLHCDYDAELYEASTVRSFLEHVVVLLGGMAGNPDDKLFLLPLLTEGELQKLLVEWNNTATEFPKDASIQQMFEAQAARTPDGVAAVFRDEQLTYSELNARANKLAHHLIERQVGPDTLVGIFVERSLEMLVGLLGILKAGGAYVPLDPNYPSERLAFMIEDARMPVLLTQKHSLEALPRHSARVVTLDAGNEAIERQPDTNPAQRTRGDNLAYVIYTSGSTGKPKGVMIQHRNVANFFAGMDQHIGGDGPGVWLAVTSISFDISVLELFWTLARGFKVVIYKADHEQSGSGHPEGAPKRKMDFSLFYFASDAGQDMGDRYWLLREGAKFADQNGFAAVWTPERHFHVFGGLYPNPAVTSAAVASWTERVRVMAGSVVLPLQNPIRVAEEWSVVDNLSRGRVGLSFATGWQVNDFVLAPQNYADRKAIMFREIETVRRLWRGETLQVPGVGGKEVAVKILPQPVQKDLPIWVTSSGSAETFRMAGEIGANVLTHIIGQTIEDLAQKILAYRKAWKEKGHAGEGQVTLMIHAFVGADMEQVRRIVREPFKNYLRMSADLVKNCPWAFSPTKNRAKGGGREMDLAAAEMEELLEHACERYFESSALFGTAEVCLKLVEHLRAVGVDELACLVDFGIESKVVYEHLKFLNEVRERANVTSGKGFSLPALIARHQVTHLQCTPSMAGMLMGQPESKAALGGLRKMLVGGEALPEPLARSLREVLTDGTLHNMYGPTETTVWSTTERVNGGVISIGRPIANTQIYMVDRHLQLVPPGTAGELCIGGAGVVRGYLNRPDLTEQKFVRDPFSKDPQARMYRTGDLARFRSDGSIEFLGRMDHQVKIRGYRIELPEIEAVLGQYPTVRETAVTVREDVPGDKRVVAYLVMHANAPRESKALRAYLQEKLPEYMVPGIFVFLDKLPLTPNGKIDRRALPAPDQLVVEETASSFVAPRNEVEEAVAAVWAELLGLPQLGVEDNFFEAGGHSLLATQIIGRLRESFRMDLQLRMLFENPTVAKFSQAIVGAEPKPGLVLKIAKLLKQVEAMSEEEIAQRLQARKAV